VLENNVTVLFNSTLLILPHDVAMLNSTTLILQNIDVTQYETI